MLLKLPTAKVQRFYIHTWFIALLVLWLVFAGCDHELWSNILIEVLLADNLEVERRLLQTQAILVRVFGGLACCIVANDRVQACDEHETVIC